MDRMIQANVIAMSGRAVEAAGDVDVLLLDKTGTITLGNRQADGSSRPTGVEERTWPTRPSLPRWPTRRRKAAASWSWPRNNTACAERDITGPRRTFVPFTAQTRMSGVDLDGRRDPQGRGRRHRSLCDASRAASFPPRSGRSSNDIAKRAAPRWWWPTAARALGVDPSQGHRQRRDRGAFRRPARDGHQDGHDHRRQPAHGGRHRRRGRRGRLPGPGHAGDQAEAHPRVSGGRAPGGHDRRRDQRRPGPGPGRCGRGHEHRHPGRQGGGQHGGPRLQPHQAHRDRRRSASSC